MYWKSKSSEVKIKVVMYSFIHTTAILKILIRRVTMNLENINTKEDLENMLSEIGQQMILHSQMQQQQKAASFRYLNKTVIKGQILFTGSSLMEQFPVCELAQNAGIGKIIYNRGIGGFTTDDFLREIDTVLFDLEPSCVFINIGTNDMREWEDGSDWLTHLLDNYDQILKLSRERLPQARFYLMAYYPVNASVPAAQGLAAHMLKVRTNENIALANSRVSGLAEKYGYQFIDVNQGLTDELGNLKAEYTIEGVHMYSNAYQVVFENLKQYL